MTKFIKLLTSLINTNVAAIKAKTDNMPVDPADQSMIDAKLGVVTDFAAHQTLLGYQNSLYQHVHQPSECYPDLADGVTVTGGAVAWALGEFAEIVPVNAITTSFDIHYVVIEDASNTDVYQIKLYAGELGSEVEIGCVKTKRDTNLSGIPNVPIQIPAQPANTRISAKIASKAGGSHTLTMSVYYHGYI